VQKIYEFLDKSDEDSKFKNSSYKEEKTTAKFVFDERAMGFLIGKGGYI
jgi:hypothetical protein